MDCFHLLKAAKRVTFWNELRDSSLVQSSSYQQDNVVNHIAVPGTYCHSEGI